MSKQLKKHLPVGAGKKRITTMAFWFLSTPAFAGTLEPLDTTGLSARAGEEGIVATAPSDGLAATGLTPGLHVQAPSSPIGAQGQDPGLDAQAQPEGLTGFVEAAPPPAPSPIAPPVVEKPPIGFTLTDLHFDYDSAALAESEIEVIADLAATIRRVGVRRVTLIGHTDRRGNRAHNQELSERRARAVRDALVTWHGFDRDLFVVIGRGEDETISAGVSEADHARDRRVVVLLDPA